MIERTKRRLSPIEIHRLCQLADIDPESVLEVYVDHVGQREIVLKGTIEKIQVNATVGQEPE